MSTPTPSSNFSTLLLSPSQLASQASLLSQLREIVNHAYIGTHFKLEDDLGVERHSIFPGLRLDDELQLCRELPEESILALMFDDAVETPSTSTSTTTTPTEPALSDRTFTQKIFDIEHNPNGNGHPQEEHSRNYNAPQRNLIAVASIKKWKGTVMSKHYRTLRSSSLPFPSGSQYPTPSPDPSSKRPYDPEPERYHEWEIATCAIVNDIKYRRMGLITRLNDILVSELRRRLNQTQAPQKDTPISTSFENGRTTSNGKKIENDEMERRNPIRLWVSALGGSYNVEYWQKRGYIVQGEPETAPPGVWGNAKDIQIWTMNKVLE